jgi:PAS domain S-box-containing protein
MVLESVTDYAIFTIDDKNRVTSWNSGAQKTFGYTESEIIGQGGEILFTGEDRRKGEPRREMQTARETGKAEDERWHVRKDGSLFFASGVMQPMRTEGGGGFVKICRDQTDKLEAQTAIRDRRMLKRLVQTQEDERKRISRDLHDQLGQQLTALRLKLEALRANHALEPKLLNAIDETQELAHQIDSDVSFLTWELRPTALDNLGLRNALANFVVEWSKNYGIPAEFHTARLRKARLMPEIDINLYRIAQEALNNTLKHAKATKVDVLLEFGKNDVVLVIEDNGVGFNPEARSKPKDSGQGLGLIGMRERAALLGGTLQIESARHKGTTIIARVPAVYAGQKPNGKPKPAAKK